jgi:hypothetical protein
LHLGRALSAIGIGAALTALCRSAPILALGRLRTAVGRGFILDDVVIPGLLIAFLAVAALGYHLMRRTKLK